MGYITNKKLTKIFEEIMIELYKNATPPADFLELVKNAPLNERGEKVIDYDTYEIERQKAEQIFDDILKKYKVTHKWNKSTLGFNVWLGCSPKFKKEKQEEQVKNTLTELNTIENATNI